MARTKHTARKRLTLHKNIIRYSQVRRKMALPIGGVRMPQRFRPGDAALRDIRKYNNSSALLIRRLPFQRLVREIAKQYKPNLNFRTGAMLALQEASESYIVSVMVDAYSIAMHSKRVTLMSKDISLACKIRGDR